MLVQSPRVRAYLELVRLPNLFTAVGDIVAGDLIVSRGVDVSWRDLAHPETGECRLYAGGVVLNDYFDRDVDAVERPERPIPSGRIHERDALKLGGRLLGSGCIFSVGVGVPSLLVAALLAGCIVLYDAKGQAHRVRRQRQHGRLPLPERAAGCQRRRDRSISTRWLWYVAAGRVDRDALHLGCHAAGDRRGLGR